MVHKSSNKVPERVLPDGQGDLLVVLALTVVRHTEPDGTGQGRLLGEGGLLRREEMVWQRGRYGPGRVNSAHEAGDRRRGPDRREEVPASGPIRASTVRPFPALPAYGEPCLCCSGTLAHSILTVPAS